MAPYSDSMDGPVVKAAETALDMENIKYVLPYVSPEDEDELKEALEKTLTVRELSGDAAELADYWFFETAVRLHHKEVEKSYTGLGNSQMDYSPIVTKADLAIETENINELLNSLLNLIREDIKGRFEDVLSKKDFEIDDVEDARDYINARADFIEFTNHIYNYFEEG